ncbi:MAG TPA: hypothetical protein VJZ49_04555 [Syntrophales bacterium]|nr:hypothetical protein [Syntrophales bacterium]
MTQTGQNEIPLKAEEPRISVDYTPGRWGRVFHLFDGENREIRLLQKDAVRLARNIIKIASEKK